MEFPPKRRASLQETSARRKRARAAPRKLQGASFFLWGNTDPQFVFEDAKRLPEAFRPLFHSEIIQSLQLEDLARSALEGIEDSGKGIEGDSEEQLALLQECRRRQKKQLEIPEPLRRTQKPAQGSARNRVSGEEDDELIDKGKEMMRVLLIFKLRRTGICR
jgi:hypothetical protein